MRSRVLLWIVPLVAMGVVLMLLEVGMRGLGAPTVARPEAAMPAESSSVDVPVRLAPEQGAPESAPVGPLLGEREAVGVLPNAERVEHKGTVIDGRLRTPIRGAVVSPIVETLPGHGAPQAVTDEVGAFALKVPTDIGLRVTAAGFAPRVFPAPAELPDPLVLELEAVAALRVVFAGPGGGDELRGGRLLLWEGRSERASGDPEREVLLPEGVPAPLDLALRPGLWSLALVSDEGPLVVVPELRLLPGERETAEVLVPARATWRGRVLLKKSRIPVEGVRVQLTPEHGSVRRAIEDLATRVAFSGPDGSVEVHGLTEGDYRLEWGTPWGQPYQFAAKAQVGDLPPPQVLIVAPPAGLSGVVRDREGRGVAGVEVCAVTSDHFEGAGLDARAARAGRPELVKRAMTAADGTFVLPEVAANRPLVVLVRAEGHVLAKRTVDVDEGTVQEDVELVIAPPRPLLVRVVDADGVALQGAEVQLSGQVGPSDRWSRRGAQVLGPQVETDGDGLASVTFVPGVHQTVVGRMAGHSRRTQELSPEAMEVDLVLDRDPTIEGILLDASGAALAGITVEGVEDGGGRRRRWNSCRDETDAAGRFRLPVGAGEHKRIQVSERGWRTLEPVVAVEGDTDLILRAERDLPPEPGVLRGQAVLAGTGAPIPGLEVQGARGGVLHRDGSFFEVREVTPSELAIGITGDGVEVAWLPSLELPSGGALDLGRIELRRTCALELRVLGAPEGQKVGARLHPVSVEEGGSPWAQRRDLRQRRQDRSVLELAVARGTWRLVVDCKGTKRVSQKIELKGAKQELTIRLEPKGR